MRPIKPYHRITAQNTPVLLPWRNLKAMPKLRLTVAAVERIKPPDAGQVEYFDTYLPSFGLRVSYSGTKAWILMTRVDRKLTRITLGRYPAMSLATAREKARTIVDQARAGIDPRLVAAEERRRLEQERKTTFDGVAAEFMAMYVERELRPNTAREYRRLLHGPDTSAWQAKPVAALGKRDVVDLLHRMEERGSPAAANRALAYLSKLFNWCLEQDLIATNPTTRVRAPTLVRPRERVLGPEELEWVWRAMADLPGVFSPLFKILLLTGQRRSEVAGMRWDELRSLNTEHALWELPAQRTKNGQPHLVPLASSVQEILLGLPRTGLLVFSTTSTTAVSGFSKAKSQLDQRVTTLRGAAGLPALPPWTLHDLRRTMVTMMNEHLGVTPHVVEAVVNHVSGPAKRGVAGVYNRAVYLDERRKALIGWSKLVIKPEA